MELSCQLKRILYYDNYCVEDKCIILTFPLEIKFGKLNLKKYNNKSLFINKYMLLLKVKNTLRYAYYINVSRT